MILTDTRLADPTAKAVHAAVTDAFRATSEYDTSAHVPHTKISVKRVSDRAAAEPEGVEFWATRASVATGIAGHVLIAWWTAVSGRRHVRVVARVVTPETGYLVNAAKLGTRPPVWHVFPDRVYRRRVGKANDLVAVCGCGAVGTENALGWAGPCCGPCADYRDEHGALPWTRPALLPTTTPCAAVAASADGRRLAAAWARGEKVCVWDVDAAEKPVHTWEARSEDAAVEHVALSNDGGYLALAGRSNNRLHVLDLRAAPPRVSFQVVEAQALAFHPTADALHFVTGGTILVASPPDARAHGAGVPVEDAAGSLVFNRDGSRFAVRRGQHIHVYRTGGAALAAIPIPASNLYRGSSVVRAFGSSRLGPPHVAFTLDGGQIAIGYNHAVAVHHAVTGERRYWDGDLPDVVSGVAFDPGGRWLYVGRRDGTLVAHRTDVISDERSVVFRWSLGPIRGLATCGDTLVTACDEGVQLWPMAKLLEGV